MGLPANMAPHIRDALLEIPTTARSEVSDALVEKFEFEEWRLSQDPVVDDTPANRANYISLMLAHFLVYRIKDIVKRRRTTAATSTLDDELGI